MKWFVLVTACGKQVVFVIVSTNRIRDVVVLSGLCGADVLLMAIFDAET